MQSFSLGSEQFIGQNIITLGDKEILFPSPIRNIEFFDEQRLPRIVILYHYEHNNVKPHDVNNLHCYDPNGEQIWIIKDLVPAYNRINTENFRIDNYFTRIRKLDFNILYAYSAECHFYINVPKGRIVYMEGHR